LAIPSGFDDTRVGFQRMAVLIGQYPGELHEARPVTDGGGGGIPKEAWFFAAR